MSEAYERAKGYFGPRVEKAKRIRSAEQRVRAFGAIRRSVRLVSWLTDADRALVMGWLEAQENG